MPFIRSANESGPVSGPAQDIPVLLFTAYFSGDEEQEEEGVISVWRDSGLFLVISTTTLSTLVVFLGWRNQHLPTARLGNGE